MDARELVLRLLGAGGIAALGGYITTLVVSANPQVSRILQVGVGLATLLMMAKVIQVI